MKNIITNPNDPLWVEKYRPHEIDSCVLPKRIKNVVKGHLNNNCIAQHLLFHGFTGTGKTTVAKALCKEIGNDYLMINGSDEGRSIKVLHEQICVFAQTHSLKAGSPHKVVIVDEADELNYNSVQPALRRFMEQYSDNCKFIFTCNHVDKIIPEIQGRMAMINFNIDAKEQYDMMIKFLDIIKDILDNESVSYNEKVLKHVISEHFPNFRKMINILQNYGIGHGTIDTGILVKTDKEIFNKLITIMKKAEYNDVWDWVVNHADVDPQTIFRYFFQNSKTVFSDDKSKALAAILTNKYQRYARQVADKDINILAYFIDIMCDCDFT